MGPTASGKTASALGLAERMPIEVVSVDSAQVYRGMDVCTAKPSKDERARVPHHLIDIVDPTEAYSAGRFRDDALRLVREIHARGRVPVLAGGTMPYFRALQRGPADLPPAQPAIRAAIEEEAARADRAGAGRIEPSDAQRIQRALEVFRHSGRPLSEWHARSEQAALPFERLAISLEPSDRARLHERIARRFRAMLEAGLVEELKGL